MVRPITETYFGNKKLIAGEQEREHELLNNIEVAIAGQIKEQHEQAKSSGAKATNAEKMIEQVANLVISHIVKGNDIKLLAIPQTADKPAEDAQKTSLRAASNEAKNARRELPPSDITKLLEIYGQIKGE